MRWEEFLKQVKDFPIIESEALIQLSPSIRIQISRWEKSKKIIKAKRGIYILKEQYRKKEIFEPYLASILKRPSYISLEKALEYHNLIPEGVNVFTSITTKRQARFISEIGVFDYRHIKPSLFWGYNSIKLREQVGFIASPEKAILDYLYLKAPSVSWEFLKELRLQNTQKLSVKKLREYSKMFNKKYILQAVELFIKYINEDKKEEKRL